MTRILTVALLMMFSMGARAQISIVLGGEKNDGVFAGGTITAKQNDAKDGKATVTLIATPETDYTINKDDIFVYETISPNMTRADESPTIGNRLKLDGPEGDITQSTEYTVTVDEKFGLWVKEAEFKEKSRDSKGGTNNVYVYVSSDGHYLAHCGNEVSISSPIQVSDPTTFNPNTCLWEAITNPESTNNKSLRAYGTESLENPYYLQTLAATTYYNAMVSKTPKSIGDVDKSTVCTWVTSLVGTTDPAYPRHYYRYHSTYGWIAAENHESSPYNASAATSAYAVTITEDVGSYQGPVATITGDDELTDFGTYEYTASSAIETTAYSNYVFSNGNHYWYENSDHGNTTPVDWSGTLTSTWSIADNGGHATIDANGKVTICKRPVSDLLLTIQLTVSDGTRSCVFTKNVTLKGSCRYVIKDDLGRLMQLSGTSLGEATAFNPNNTIWTSELNGTRGVKYSITSGITPYYLTIANWTGPETTPVEARVDTNPSEYNRGWSGVSPEYLKSAGNYYVYRENNLWNLTKSEEVDHRVKAYPATIERYNFTKFGDDGITCTGLTDDGEGQWSIDYTDDYACTVIETDNICDVYSFDSQTHYWYEEDDHNSAPDYLCWSDVSELTKTWTLSAEAAGYATVDPDGTLHVVNLPTTGSVIITLTYTISKGEENPQTVSKTILLKPEAIQAPVISLTKAGDVTKLNISSVQTHDLALYYEMGNSEPATDDPTKESDEYDKDNPPTVGDDIVCIKAIAVHHSGCSEVTTYNILRFSTETVGSGENEATVAPMVYSSDLTTPEGMTTYIVSRVTPLTNSVVLTELAYIPKNVPVLLLDKGKHEGAMTDITLSAKEESTPTVPTSVTAANLLKVSDGTIKVSDAQVYMYQKGEFVLTFNGTLKNGRYYLNNPNYRPSSSQPSGARLYIDFEKTTDIKGIKDLSTTGTGVEDDIYYSLDGRRLSGTPTQKGVYVCNGRKIVIK